ncbi:MAG: FRG domain-containing protein [Nitrospirae bacterium]|nr:FRG domain-containing protein [Nitrospirota bacterium]
METVRVNSVEEFASRVRIFRNNWDKEELWFRGEDSSRYRNPLRPSIYRPPRPAIEHEARENEDETRIEFSRRGHSLVIERTPENELDWYILMRHNEVPTRLLDWTEASLIALFFAVRDRGRANSDNRTESAAVWVLDPEWLNKKVIGKYEFVLPSDPIINKYLPEPRKRKPRGLLPIAILPRYPIRQMLSQRSTFTIQGAPNGFDLIRSRRGERRIAKIVVRKSSFGDILNDLSSCGIDEATLFPTLTGLGKEVTALYLNYSK